jgi:hypothetical protein
MAYQKNHRKRSSSKTIDFLLVLGILGGAAYLAYTHPNEVQSLKSMVGLSKPEAMGANPVSAPSQPAPSSTSDSSSPPAPAPAPTTTQSTNGIANPPLVGQPRPALPAQDHWMWTTTDGKTYREVKIEKIEKDYVTIIHAEGGVRIPISTLPDDVQKALDDYSSQTQ